MYVFLTRLAAVRMLTHRNCHPGLQMQFSTFMTQSKLPWTGTVLLADAPPMQTQAQQQMEEENRALQAELQSLGQQVRETEKSMSEISALSQMFSQQVSMQSEKTLQLYNQVPTLQPMQKPRQERSDSASLRLVAVWLQELGCGVCKKALCNAIIFINLFTQQK